MLHLVSPLTLVVHQGSLVAIGVIPGKGKIFANTTDMYQKNLIVEEAIRMNHRIVY